MSLEKDLMEIKTQAKIILQIAKDYQNYEPQTIAKFMEEKASKILNTID